MGCRDYPTSSNKQELPQHLLVIPNEIIADLQAENAEEGNLLLQQIFSEWREMKSEPGWMGPLLSEAA